MSATTALKLFEDTQSTMILMMLYPLATTTEESHDEVARKVRGERTAIKRFPDQGTLIGAKPVSPSSAYTFDATDRDRMYATGPEYLLRHPAEILGDRAELMMMCEDGTIKWTCFIRKEKPKKVICAEKIHSFYEFHCMTGGPKGWYDYGIRAIAFNKNGRPLMMKIAGMHGHTGQDAFNAFIAASVIEDAHRAGSVLCTLEAESKITFPVSIDEYKQFLADRDGHRNTPTGRRNTILHFCGEHARRRGGKLTEVRAHARGARVFETGGMTLTITPPPEWEELSREA
ncbi:hypothetical protein CNQ84_00800 [Pseudomonas abyssi]|uniref:Uncharacterized protein n=1 Tax=Pseudomonas abyssi TaxID=170540 RepID=A0A2A3MMB8_9PSED|nr:hypothetical protein [Pseudomonas abyssi]PBK05948.1 hypothetical protein CNQ84_00800 [Pseudomonas abyssi]